MPLLGMTLPGWVKWAALAVLALSLYAFGRLDGTRIEGARHADYVAKQATQALVIRRAQERIVVQTEIRYRDRIQVIREKGDRIVEQVPIYITAEIDRRFPLPAGFVRLHDAAAIGEPAGAPGDPDGEASAVAPSDAATIIAKNYTDCRRYAEQVRGWQAFYSDLQSATSSP